MSNFFAITTFENNDGIINASVAIDAAHPIFDGHFPGQPVVPGVCLVQIITELSGKACGKKLQLQKAGDIKFLSVVDPVKDNVLRAEIKYSFAEDGVLHATAALDQEDRVCLKMKGSFIEKSDG